MTRGSNTMQSPECPDSFVRGMDTSPPLADDEPQGRVRVRESSYVEVEAMGVQR
jgi:hypothetical protein